MNNQEPDLDEKCWAYIDERFDGRLLRFEYYEKLHLEKNHLTKDIVGNLKKEIKGNKMIETPNNANYCLDDEIGYTALIQHIGDDCSVVNSARVSFGKQINQIEDKDRKLIKFLLEHSHGSPLEHNSLTFLVKCPLFVARQWMRHRISSFNEVSARYVEVKDEFYIPQNFRKQSTSNRQASIDEFIKQDDGDLCLYVGSLYGQAHKLYKEMLEAGVCREQARAVLPLATYTQYYWTCNLRSFLHFIKLRDHKDAQYEIQQYARAMLEQVKEIFPETIKIWQELNNHNKLL